MKENGLGLPVVALQWVKVTKSQGFMFILTNHFVIALYLPLKLVNYILISYVQEEMLCRVLMGSLKFILILHFMKP
jgi:hypothetical protein